MLITYGTDAAVAKITTEIKTTFQLIGDIGTFSITFERPDGVGGWLDHYVEGVAVVLDADNTSVTTEGGLRLRVNKPDTTGNPCGVEAR